PDASDPEVFHDAFLGWLTQCWLYDERFPEGQDLANFDLDAPIPRFRRKLVSGDSKRMQIDRGATLEEYLLCTNKLSSDRVLRTSNFIYIDQMSSFRKCL